MADSDGAVRGLALDLFFENLEENLQEEFDKEFNEEIEEAVEEVMIAETLHLKSEVGRSPFPSRYI